MSGKHRSHLPADIDFFPYFELTLDEAKYIHANFRDMAKNMPWWE